MHKKALNVVMLAGGLRASTFRQQLGIPTLCLPMSHDATLLDAWLACLGELGRPCAVDIVVSWQTDAEQLEPLVRRRLDGDAAAMDVRVITDPAPWRGTGGLLKDVTRSRPAEDLIVVVESSCLPPVSLRAALDALKADASGVVCSGAGSEPAGVYIFRRATLDLVPDEGFFDLKEQFLPRLYLEGRWLTCAVVAESVARLRDCGSYLRSVGKAMADDAAPLVSSEARVAVSARIVGASVVQAGVVVESGALVHNSVVMRGAMIGARAVVSRSIVGMNAVIAPGEIRRDTVEPYRQIAPPSRSAAARSAARGAARLVAQE
jgi:carbonic anhydrase/acetyltransferase-like protein (isoleucine patch superfamily)